MAPESVNRLESFLSQFNLPDLGDGNSVAGPNTLATALCSIANVSRPGSRVISKNERVFGIGANLVVSGGLSASLCQEHVGEQLASHQDSFNSHIKSYLATAEDAQRSATFDGWSHLPEPEGTSSQKLFFGLQQKDHLPFQTTQKEWEEVLNSYPQPTRDELYQNSQVYLRTSEPNKIGQGLANAHCGKPLLDFGLQSPEQFNRSHPILTRVMDGYNLESVLPSFHQGNVFVRDPTNNLYQIIKESPMSFPRFVWLLDGSPGMDLPEPPPTTTLSARPLELRHLVQALLTAFARRVDHHQPYPHQVRLEISRLHTQWVSFLQTQEDDYPGITGIAKKLLATLAFGLKEVSVAYEAEYRKILNADGIYEFAQYLILRSVAARKSILWAEEIERDQHLKARLLARLQSKALPNRDLYRSLCIPAAKCEELLSVLEQEGAVLRENNTWNLTSEELEHGHAVELHS